MIKQGRSTVGELASTLRPLEQVDVRLMVRRVEEQPLLVTSIVNAGQDSTGFREEVYDYGHVAFAKAVLKGSTVADWLTQKRGQVGDVEFSLPEPSSDCLWVRSESRSYAHHGTFLTVPHTDYSVIAGNRQELSWPSNPLAGSGLPFFPDERVAAASVLLDEHSASFNRDIPRDLMLIRIAHPEAYIGEVRVSSTAIVTSVLGENLEGTYLQVASAGNRHEERVREPGDIRVPISGADSTDAWVSLVRRDKCLDFRRISSHWPDLLDQEGIFYEPDDLSERLERMRLAGESETVEFKQVIPKGDVIPKAVAAFANGRGGTIIIGIRDGTWDVAGLDGDVAVARDRLDNIVRNSVSPPPKYDLLTGTLHGRTVIAMRVAPGDDRPYGVGSKGGRHYYVRRGANNWVAEPEEMRELCKPRKPRRHRGFSFEDEG